MEATAPTVPTTPTQDAQAAARAMACALLARVDAMRKQKARLGHDRTELGRACAQQAEILFGVYLDLAEHAEALLAEHATPAGS